MSDITFRHIFYREMHELRRDFGFEVIDLRMTAPLGNFGLDVAEV